MTPFRFLAFLGLLLPMVLMVVSCQAESPSGAQAMPTTPPGDGSPQELPFVDVVLASHPLKIMIARTESQRATGLMYRRTLNPDEGMLFCYSTPHQMVFWMKNTILPLDLVFFSPDLTLTEIIPGMVPGIGLPDSRLPRYAATLPAQYALELASGSSSRLGLQTGDRLQVPLPLLFSDE